MEKTYYSRILEDRLIKKYKEEFLRKTGKLLRIQDHDLSSLPYPIYSLDDLKDKINELLPEPYVDITQLSRKKEIVYYRMFFCNIAYSMGYSLKQIGEAVQRDHSTVYHAIETIDDIMESNDVEIKKIYNIIITHLL